MVIPLKLTFFYKVCMCGQIYVLLSSWVRKIAHTIIFFFLEEKNPNEAISNACDICLWFHYFLSTVYPKPTNNTRISTVLPDYYTPISLIYYSNHRYSISSHRAISCGFSKHWWDGNRISFQFFAHLSNSRTRF